MENKLTEGSNMRWESSRMVLPEHREQIRQQQRELRKKRRPLLDEQAKEEMERVLHDSCKNRRPVSVILFGEYVDQAITGMITYIDSYSERVKVDTEAGSEWLDMEEIVSVF